MPAAGGEERGVSALAVQRVRGDQASGQFGQAVQGGGEGGDLVAVGDRGLW